MRPSAKRRRRAEVGFVLVLGTLSALSCNGIGCDGCGGAARRYPSETPINVAPPDGSVSIGGKFDICPVVSMEVTPTDPRVGQPVTVKSTATDVDLDGGLLTFQWTATAGSFVAPMAHDTTYNCGPAGPVTITLTVSDGVCPTQKVASIFCVAMSDGGIPSGTGGTTGTGGTNGGGGAGGAGGGGVVNTCPGAEPGSEGAMGGKGGAGGGAVSACAQCTTDNCSLGMTGTDGCCGLVSPPDQLLCEALYNCIAANTATCTSAGDPTNCFCGTAPSGGTCFAVRGAANGPCAAQVIAAAKTDDPAQIQARFVSPNFPLGRAANLAACRGALCSAECGIN